jgi:hypothetical protein
MKCAFFSIIHMDTCSYHLHKTGHDKFLIYLLISKNKSQNYGHHNEKIRLTEKKGIICRTSEQLNDIFAARK